MLQGAPRLRKQAPLRYRSAPRFQAPARLCRYVRPDSGALGQFAPAWQYCV